ncbi:hypothetical protein [Alteromonas gilva]|uniref:PH domain-containing protein n=1 Tax=Alteromonas gilva TaxID=2987522 RepID=A0ABT5L0Q4_9ALTE|nr:hypothetical protein [Alteromonas gilva]MDC8830611.1 hypothetical protein [Alteromonas gilva]
MKYTQSRLQSIIFRTKNVLSPSFFLLLLLFLVVDIDDPNTQSIISTTLLLMFGIPALLTLWLVFFNSGKSRIDEYFVELTDREFRYGHLAGLDIIPWSEFKTYAIHGWFSKTITVYGAKKNIYFELRRFNKAQQTAIIKALDERVNQTP